MKKKKARKGQVNATLLRLEVATALVLFWIGVLLTRNGMGPLEESIFVAIYTWPAWLSPFFLVITQLGNITVLMALALGGFIFKKYTLVIRLLMSGSLAYLLAGVGKDLVGRARPDELVTSITYRDQMIRGSGFPSGHMALATALAFTMGYYLPRRYWYVTPLIIIGVGLSRVYLGVHAPLDLLGGFAIGWFSAEVFRFVEIKLIKM